VEQIPVDAFLAAYPGGIRAEAQELRRLVRQVVPDVTERVRLGWRLVGYDLPQGCRHVYFAWVAPELEHVHIGFQYGIWMRDPEHVLRGAHLKLKKVRYLTFRADDPIPAAQVRDFIREAAEVAAMTAAQRMSLTLDEGWAPQEPSAPQ